jgi:4-amino-4-deoxy-L-arabinose transferase-like glycosyltransferase
MAVEAARGRWRAVGKLGDRFNTPTAAQQASGAGGAVGIAAWALLLFIVLFWRLGAPTFWDPDEAHYAETTRELLRTGDWLVPQYNEQPFFDKPILFHWLQAISMAIVGPNELGARLVPAVAALALVAITAWLGAALVSIDVGLVAALLLATSPAVFALARYAILDSLFTAFLFGGAAMLTVAALRDRARLQWGGYVLIGLAVLTKGPLALILCGLTLLLAALVSPELRRRFFGLRVISGLGLVAAIAAPWFVYMWLRFGHAFVAGCLLDENIRLYVAARFGARTDAWFYLRVLAAGLLPWTGLLLGRLFDDARSVFKRERSVDSFEILLWCWTIAVVGFFSLSSFKLDHYVFPAAPALYLLCARAWADLRRRTLDRLTVGARIGFRTVGPVLVLIGAGGGYFMIARLDLPIAATVVPAGMLLAGAAVTVRAALGDRRPPRVPWIVLAALGLTYAGVVLFVMPALEQRKVVPDLARWVAGHASAHHRVGLYRLNRWSSAFRFYVDRHATHLEGVAEARAFFEGPEPFYCVMLESAYKEFLAQGQPLKIVYERDGMWVTSGRALWRRPLRLTRFVVVTRAERPAARGSAAF